MNDYVIKNGQALRRGYTTGSCASAAAKAAAWTLFTGKTLERVEIKTPSGIALKLPVEYSYITKDQVTCGVKKDSGDDPDVTNGMTIYASVSFTQTPEIIIDGGTGIGRVTKRGLDQPVGAAAINSIPRKMIKDALLQLCSLFDYKGGLSVLITAPDGETVAKKTFNERLGIVGGISILGTTGIVEPMSEDALKATIRLELNQRAENGERYVLLTPGNYGADFISKNLNIKNPVLVSNFIGDAFGFLKELGLSGALLVGHLGKLIKLAGGMFNTHSKYGDCRMEILASHAGAAGLSAPRIAEILDCAVCDDALRILTEENLLQAVMERIIDKISMNIHYYCGDKSEIGVIIFTNEYGLLCRTTNADKILSELRKV